MRRAPKLVLKINYARRQGGTVDSGLVAATGTAAVVVYRYFDVGAIGPIPDMYDPYWAPPEKTLSAVAEGLAALAALALLVMFHLRARSAAAPAGKDGVESFLVSRERA
jgi:hypothetical protein